MKKKDLIYLIAEETGLTQKKSAEVLDFIFKTILRTALREDSYQHPGFGKFVILERKKRVIHNVALRILTKIPKKKLFRFIPSRRLLQKLNLQPKSRNEK